MIDLYKTAYFIIFIWILYNIFCYLYISFKYNMKFDLKKNYLFFIYSLFTGIKIYYCEQKLNKITINLLSNESKSLVAEWRIGIQPFKNKGILSVPVTMDEKYHKKALNKYTNILNKYNNSLPDERIDKLINKYMLENNIFDYKNIAEFGIKNIDINNKLNDKDIFEFSKIGCEIMKYINSEITYSTLFPFMMGFQISKKRKFLSNQTKYLIDKYMDNELFDLDKKNIKDDDIAIGIFFYGGILFSSINNITGILLALSNIDKKKKDKLKNDDFYRKEFINEMIRIYSSLPLLARKVENFNIIFSNINEPISWEFDWILFEKHYEDKKRFDSFGFGKRQCVAKGWINKIYERIILNIINKYNIEVCYIEKNIKPLERWGSAAYQLNPKFKLHKI
jgi:hypothetical protein